MTATTSSGNDAPRLACSAALSDAANSGKVKLAPRFANNVWPASIRPSSPPPKLAARLAANSCATSAKPLSEPLKAATNSGNEAPRLACSAALSDAANCGRLRLPDRLAANV
ncbi:hypothetical protein MYIN104542_00240 [Mycobacterium intermedium]